MSAFRQRLQISRYLTYHTRPQVNCDYRSTTSSPRTTCKRPTVVSSFVFIRLRCRSASTPHDAATYQYARHKLLSEWRCGMPGLQTTCTAAAPPCSSNLQLSIHAATRCSGLSASLAVALCAVLIVVSIGPLTPTEPFLTSLARRRLLYQPPLRTLDPYSAPLRSCDSKTRVPHEYIIFLDQDYSLEEHKQAIGEMIDLDSTIISIFPREEDRGLSYYGTLYNDSVAAVRADIGVDLVECNIRVVDIEGLAPR